MGILIILKDLIRARVSKENDIRNVKDMFLLSAIDASKHG